LEQVLHWQVPEAQEQLLFPLEPQLLPEENKEESVHR
jgi:hypothetical protein